ncbi:MAG: hypothetical protein ACE5NW_00495 [Acidiferrobacterales bacterium]
MSSQKPIDRALDEYLQNRSVLSRVYKATTDENPPDELDAAILSAARQATKATSRVARSPFTRNWMIPASLAAVLVLTVGLVTFMFDEDSVPFSPKSLSEPTLESAMEEELSQGKRDDTSAVVAGAPADAAADSKAALKRKRKVTAARAPAAQNTALMKQEAAPAEQKPASARPPVAPESTTARQEASLKERKMVTAEPSKKAREQARSSSAGVGGAVALDESALEKDEELRKQGRLGESSVALMATTESKELSPQESLEEIGGLLRQGKVAEGYDRLAAFEKRYPDYPLPFEPVSLRISVDGRPITDGEVITLKRGQSVQLKVEVMRPDGTISDVTNHPFMIIATKTPWNLAVSDTGLVTAPLGTGFSRETQSLTGGSVDIWYGFRRDSDERLNEAGVTAVEFELVD